MFTKFCEHNTNKRSISAARAQKPAMICHRFDLQDVRAKVEKYPLFVGAEYETTCFNRLSKMMEKVE